MTLAPHPIAREFEADVLEQLVKGGARMYGCAPLRVSARIDGSVRVTFRGLRDGVEWTGGCEIDALRLSQKKYLGDSTAVADAFAKLLRRFGLEGPQPLIGRAS